MKLEFTKMQALGNDYIYVDCFKTDVPDPEDLSKSLAIRRFSIGSDGLVLILPSAVADAEMRVFNADGSRAATCGNALRCVAKYLYDGKMIKGKTAEINTLAGVRTATIIKDYGKSAYVRVDMGKASFRPSAVPVISGGEVLLKPYVFLGRTFFLTCLSVGNPHAVAIVDDFKHLSASKVGRAIETDGIFPKRTNVEFVRIVKNTLIELKVWERGSGLTYACGSGACAAVCACAVNGFLPFAREVTVVQKGGRLKVVAEADLSLTLEGEAVRVFDGVVEI